MQSLKNEHGEYADVRTHELVIVIEGKQFEWLDQYITGRQAKQLRELPLDAELYLQINEPWKDEPIGNDDRVDLARPAIECFFVKQKLKYFIYDKEFESSKQYMRGTEIRKEGNIPPSHDIFLKIEGPWKDELIQDEEWVDLARPGVEHFYSREVKVVLIVNGTPKDWNNRKISFKEVILLAYGNYIDSPTMVYTVGYEDGPKQNPEGSMRKDESVFVKDKMIFHATATDKS